MLNRLKAHLKALTDIGSKPCGSEAGELAAAYIEQQLRLGGSEVRVQDFTFAGWRNLGPSRFTLRTPQERTVPVLPFLGSGGGSFQGKLCRVGLNHVWNIYSWDRYAVRDGERIVAYLSGRTEGELLSQTLVEGNCDIPHLIVGEQENALLRAMLDHGETVMAEGFANCEAVDSMPGRNILAYFHSKAPRLGPVLVTAHRDTMYNTPGAYDNQAGVAVLLTLAELLRDNPPGRDVILAFTDAEECSLAGGRRLAEDFSPGELDFLLNIDGVGSCNEMEIWCGPTAFERQIMELLLDDPQLPNQCYRNPPPPGSDHTPFYMKGIPSVMLTFNDQGIIHTPMDRYDERLLPNMAKMLDAVQHIMNLEVKEGFHE